METSEGILVSIAHSQNEIACSPGGLHSLNGFTEGLVPLQHIPEDEGEGVSNPGLLFKCLIGIRYANFRNAHLMLVDSRENTDPPYKPDVHPGVAVFA